MVQQAMTLREKQSFFAVLVARLILHAVQEGYAVTLGEAMRSPTEAARLAKAGKGLAQSLHTSRLAIDLNLFVNGVYQSKTEAYRALGDWWERQHVLCAWGGHFGDGNHFSLSHGGKK